MTAEDVARPDWRESLALAADLALLGIVVTIASVAVVTVYFCVSVYDVFSAVNALRRSDFAPASCARERAPRNCGIAIAIKMAMINTTTMSSINVKPGCRRLIMKNAPIAKKREEKRERETGFVREPSGRFSGADRCGMS